MYANRILAKKSRKKTVTSRTQPPIPVFLNERSDSRLSKQLVCTITAAYVMLRNGRSISHRVTKRMQLHVCPVGSTVSNASRVTILFMETGI